MCVGVCVGEFINIKNLKDKKENINYYKNAYT